MIRLDIWQEVYSSIKRNKLRTFLTGFSVAWGIFILIVLLGAGNGLIHAFEDQSKDIAVNTIQIFPGMTSKPYDGLQEGRQIVLNNKDMQLSQDKFENSVTNVGAMISLNSTTLTSGENYVSTEVDGIFPEYNRNQPITIISGGGRFVNQLDMRDRRKVIVINDKSRKVLFPKDNAIGQFLKVGGVAYLVVGVYKDHGSERNSNAYIPFTTAKTVYSQGDTLSNIILTTKDLNTETANEKFEKDYRKVIAAQHRFAPDDNRGIFVWNRFTDYLEQLKTKNILNTAIWVIGILTLLSGIVGVSNIMLITVKERTKEFGIRKALGASPASILWLIIIESIVITTVFGYVGMVLGIGATEYMNLVAGQKVMDAGIFQTTVFLNPTVDIHVAVEATITLIIAGTIAGFFPAKKAVSIRPIEALRNE